MTARDPSERAEPRVSSRRRVHKTDNSCTEGRLRVVAYLRVSTAEQQESGAGLEAQRAAIRAEAVRRNWSLVAIFEDTASGKTTVGREGLTLAVEAVERGEAAALVVAKLDRLSRSLIDFAALMERSRQRKWALVALDLGVDTTTPSGELMATILATFAQFERRLIGQRTRDALAVKRAQGVRLGRPPSLPANVRARIRAARAGGMTYRAIAELLNAEVVPTAHGGRAWHASTVAKIANA
jgi:DNA invertase Pin-like site-specific DNA recombinase